MHEYLPKKISEDKEIDHKHNTQRINHKGITSHFRKVSNSNRRTRNKKKKFREKKRKRHGETKKNELRM